MSSGSKQDFRTSIGMVTPKVPLMDTGDAKPTTISQIAREARVSPTTVSRVLNHPALVTDSTRARVQSAIQQLNYKPSRAARALRTRRFGSVAVALGDTSNPFFARLTKGAQAIGDAHDITLILYDLDHSRSRLCQFLDHLPRWGVDGALIFTAFDISQHAPVLEAAGALSNDFPIVLGQDIDGFASVDSNDTEAAEQAVEHLIAMGVKRPIFLGVDPASSFAERRRVGFEQATLRAGVENAPTIPAGTTFEAGYRSALAVANTLSFDGIVAVNDQTAIGAIRALYECGILVPDDVKVIGFDGLGSNQFAIPSLSTMSIDAVELGRNATALLLGLIADDAGQHQPETARYVLTARESTRRTT